MADHDVLASARGSHPQPMTASVISVAAPTRRPSPVARRAGCGRGEVPHLRPAFDWDVEVTWLCEHHLLPFRSVTHVG